MHELTGSPGDCDAHWSLRTRVDKRDGCLHLGAVWGVEGDECKAKTDCKINWDVCVWGRVKRGSSRTLVRVTDWSCQEHKTPSRLWGSMSHVLGVESWSCLWAMQLVRRWYTWAGSSEEIFHVTTQSRRPESIRGARRAREAHSSAKTDKEKQKGDKPVPPEPLVLPQGTARQVLPPTSILCCAKSLQSRLTPRSCGLQPTRLLCPWDSLGKNTGVGCHAFPSRGSFQLRDRTHISCPGRQVLYH